MSACPAIVRVPTRCDVVVLGATVKLTEPLPEPVAPAVTVIQGTLLTAVQEQPVVVVTVVEPLAPAAGTDWLEGEVGERAPDTRLRHGEHPPGNRQRAAALRRARVGRCTEPDRAVAATSRPARQRQP